MKEVSEWQDEVKRSIDHVTKLKSWEDFFFRAPCVQYSKSHLKIDNNRQYSCHYSTASHNNYPFCTGFLLGGTCGTLTFAHKLRMYRKLSERYF